MLIALIIVAEITFWLTLVSGLAMRYLLRRPRLGLALLAARRFADGPAPERPPRSGRRHAARQRREWLRHLGAWATGTVLLGLGVLVVGDLDRTWALINVVVLWTLVLAIDFLISFSYTLWPRPNKARPIATASRGATADRASDSAGDRFCAYLA